MTQWSLIDRAQLALLLVLSSGFSSLLCKMAAIKNDTIRALRVNQ